MKQKVGVVRQRRISVWGSKATGVFNGSLSGTISIREILNYVEEKTGKKAILDGDGECV